MVPKVQCETCSEMAESKYRSRENNINLLRFIAASMVIYSHMAVLLGQEQPAVMDQSLGAIAVNVFFLLSGYLIASSWTHSACFMSYLIRRIARIFPALIVVVLATVFVVGPVATTLTMKEYFLNLETWQYLKTATIFFIEYELPGVFEGLPYPNAVNGSLWTLRVEFTMYLIVPILYMLLMRAGKARRSLLVTFLSLVLLAHFITSFDQVSAPNSLTHGFRLAAYFFTGVVIYDLNMIKHFNAQYAAAALLLMLILASETGLYCDIAMYVLVSLFAFGFCFESNPKFARCFIKNDFSYGIYIWAFPIQQCLVQFGGGGAPKLGVALFDSCVSDNAVISDGIVVFS